MTALENRSSFVMEADKSAVSSYFPIRNIQDLIKMEEKLSTDESFTEEVVGIRNAEKSVIIILDSESLHRQMTWLISYIFPMVLFFIFQQKAYLGCIQADTVTKTTSTLVNRVFSNKLSCCLCMTRSDGLKIRIKNFKITKLIEGTYYRNITQSKRIFFIIVYSYFH